MAGILSKLGDEIRAIIPPTVYFFVCFNTLVLTIHLLSESSATTSLSYAKATVGALIVGKAVLVANRLPFFNVFRRRPLVFNALWKSFLYIVFVVVFRFLEELISAATDSHGFSAALEARVEAFGWAHFWVVQMWLTILFLLYCAFCELSGALGGRRLFQFFFREPPGSLDRPAQSAS